MDIYLATSPIAPRVSKMDQNRLTYLLGVSRCIAGPFLILSKRQSTLWRKPLCFTSWFQWSVEQGTEKGVSPYDVDGQLIMSLIEGKILPHWQSISGVRIITSIFVCSTATSLRAQGASKVKKHRSILLCGLTRVEKNSFESGWMVYLWGLWIQTLIY